MSNDIVIKATIGVETRRSKVAIGDSGPDELYPLIIAEVSRVFNASVSNISFYYTDPEGSNCAFVATTLDDALACSASDMSMLKLFAGSDVKVADLSPLVTQNDEDELEGDISLEYVECGTDTAPSPESLALPQSSEPGTVPQSSELGTASALSPQSTVALCEKMGKLVLRVEKEMNAKLLQGELPTWTGPQYKSLTEACSYNFANGKYVCASEVKIYGIQDGTENAFPLARVSLTHRGMRLKAYATEQPKPQRR